MRVNRRNLSFGLEKAVFLYLASNTEISKLLIVSAIRFTKTIFCLSPNILNEMLENRPKFCLCFSYLFVPLFSLIV